MGEVSPAIGPLKRGMKGLNASIREKISRRVQIRVQNLAAESANIGRRELLLGVEDETHQ
jgi:hypothetical protein